MGLAIAETERIGERTSEVRGFLKRKKRERGRGEGTREIAKMWAPEHRRLNQRVWRVNLF